MPTPIPTGYVRNTDSGCIVSKAEEAAHAQAVAQKRARHAAAEAPNDVRSQLDAAQRAAAEANAVAADALKTAQALKTELDALKAKK